MSHLAIMIHRQTRSTSPIGHALFRARRPFGLPYVLPDNYDVTGLPMPSNNVLPLRFELSLMRFEQEVSSCQRAVDDL